MSQKLNRKQALLWIFLAFVATAMAAGLIAIIIPQRFVNDRVIATILTMGSYALAGLIVLAIGRSMRVTIFAALGAYLPSLMGFVVLIWFERSMRSSLEDLWFKAAFSTLIIGLACTHRLLIIPLDGRNGWGHLSKRIALIAAAITSAMVILFMIFEGLWGWEDIMVRLMGIGLLVTAGTSIAAGAIAIFGPKPGEDEPDVVAKSLPIQLRCPVCGNTIAIDSNRDGHCGHCKLQIRVNTAELRCDCGYLLHQLEHDICPECGRKVQAGARWPDVTAPI